MKNLLILSVFCFQISFLSAQSIDKNWYSESSNSCIKFDTTRSLMIISGFYEEFDSNWKKRIEYKIVGNILKIKWVNNQNWLWLWTSDKSEWEIVKHTKDTLQLKFISGDFSIAELIGGENVTFLETKDYDCNNYYNLNRK